MAHKEKNLLATQQMQESLHFPSLGREDAMEKDMVTLFQYSCLKKPMDRGAWQATVQWVTKSQTGLGD